MKKLIFTAALCFAALFIVMFSSCTPKAPKANLKNAVDSISYAQGVTFAAQVDQIFAQLGFEESSKADFIKGFVEGFNVDPKNNKVSAYTFGKSYGYQLASQFVPGINSHLFGDDETKTISKSNFLSGYITAIENDSLAIIKADEAQMYSMTAIENVRRVEMEKQYGDKQKENQEWLEKNKTQEGVVTLPSGLQYKVIKEGNGNKPLATNMVKVAYKGTLISGEVFDDSESMDFFVNGVIPGWTEGLQLMSEGSKYFLYVPSDLAYGDQGAGERIPPYSTLIFEVELLEIMK